MILVDWLSYEPRVYFYVNRSDRSHGRWNSGIGRLGVGTCNDSIHRHIDGVAFASSRTVEVRARVVPCV